MLKAGVCLKQTCRTCHPTTSKGKSTYSCSKQLHFKARQKPCCQRGRDAIIIQMGITASSFGLFWKAFTVLHLFVHTKMMGSCCVENEKRELGREARILPFWPLHTWPIAAWSGHGCRIVDFRTLQKLGDAAPTVPTLEVCMWRRVLMFFDDLTSILCLKPRTMKIVFP